MRMYKDDSPSEIGIKIKCNLNNNGVKLMEELKEPIKTIHFGN